MDDLNDKVAVVTGGARGVGFALCERFGAEGMKVVMADVEPVALAQAAQSLRDNGVDVLEQVADVSRFEEVEALAQAAYARFGAVHVLCNNAGVTTGHSPCWELPLADFEWVLRVDLWGAFHGIKAFVPRMIAGGEPGHVINTASVAGLLPFNLDYSATKHAKVAMAEVLFLELKQRSLPIHVSALCPGLLPTNFRANSAGLNPDIPVKQREGEMPSTCPLPDLAAMVIDAIRNRTFWIMTHPAYADDIARHTRGVLDTDEVVAGVVHPW